MAEIYARSDIKRGVHKSPANKMVRRQGINASRFFEGSDNRVRA